MAGQFRFADQVVDSNAAIGTQGRPDGLTPQWIVINQIPLDKADGLPTEVDDESLGGIGTFENWAVILFDRGQV